VGELSRRRFLSQTSLGVGVTLAAVAALPKAAIAPSAALSRQNAAPVVEPIEPAPALAGMSLMTPMLVRVRDVATAEIAVLVGEQELIYRDPALVTRLIQTANQAAERGHRDVVSSRGA
jgi:hypothetical protein